MESDTSGHRYVSWFLSQRGENAANIHRQLVEVCGSDAPSERTVRRWIEDFKAGKNTTMDRPRTGRPAESVSEENIELASQLIAADPRTTIEQLAEVLGISYGSASEIIHDQLNLSKLTCRWIPKCLTPDMKAVRVEVSRELLGQLNADRINFYNRLVTGDEKWFLYYEPESKQESREWRQVGSPPPLKPKSEPSTKKQMATVFWDREGILLIKWLPSGETINSQYYCKVLAELKEAITKDRRGKWARGVLLQHDNARPHTAHQTQLAIQQLGFSTIPHPPYSPDLAPSDYWLFGEMAKHTRGRRWVNIQELAGAVGRWSKSTPKEWFARGLEQLETRWQRCVSMKGAYVEATE